MIGVMAAVIKHKYKYPGTEDSLPNTNGFTRKILKTKRTRHCHECGRKIPPKTWILVISNDWMTSAYSKKLNQRVDLNIPVQINYCAECAKIQFKDMKERIKNWSKYYHKIERKIKLTPKNGYCCESWRLSDKCHTCKQALSCFTTIKEGRI